jgi:hypothetical protein
VAKSGLAGKVLGNITIRYMNSVRLEDNQEQQGNLYIRNEVVEIVRGNNYDMAF